MVEQWTVEPEAPGSNPAPANFFAPCCSMSQAIGCIKSLPNGRTTESQRTRRDNADDKRLLDTLMIA